MQNQFKFDESQIEQAKNIFKEYDWNTDLDGINTAKQYLETCSNWFVGFDAIDWSIMVLGSQLELRELTEEELKAKTDEIFGANSKPESESFETQMNNFIDTTFSKEEIFFLQVKSELQHLLNTREEDDYILTAMAIREIHRLEKECARPITEYPDNSWDNFPSVFRDFSHQIKYLREDSNFVDWTQMNEETSKKL